MPLARIALIFAGLVALFGLVYGVSVYTAVGRRLADSSLRGAIAARPLFFGTVSKILDVVSVASLLGAVALVAVIALVRLARLEGLLAVGILVCSNISTWLLKTVLLTRPDLGLHEIAPATLNSMPSGHATAVFSSVAALLFVAPRRWRGVSATAGAGFAAVTGLATMLAGWHRAGDSVAAFLLVGCWSSVAAAVLLVYRHHPTTRHRTAASFWLRSMTRAAVASLLLSTALAGGLVLASLTPGNVVGSAVAFVAGGLFVVGAACGTTVAVLEVLRLGETGHTSGPTDTRP